MNKHPSGGYPRKLKAKLSGLRDRFTHYRNLSLFEVFIEDTTFTLDMTLGRHPTAAEIVQAVRAVHDEAVVVDDKVYSSVEAAAKAYGVSPVGVKHRINDFDEPYDVAIKAILANRDERRLIVNGKEYPTLRAAAKAEGVDHSSVVHRKRNHNETTEQAINILKAKADGFEVNGWVYKTLKDVATDLGLSPEGLSDRMRKRNITCEEAANQMLAEGSRSISVTVKGKKFASMKEAARHFKIPPTTIYNRVRTMDETPEQAFNYVLNEQKPQRKPVTVAGVRYATIADAARAYGVEPNSLSARMRNRGETATKAIRNLNGKLK